MNELDKDLPYLNSVLAKAPLLTEIPALSGNDLKAYVTKLQLRCEDNAELISDLSVADITLRKPLLGAMPLLVKLEKLLKLAKEKNERLQQKVKSSTCFATYSFSEIAISLAEVDLYLELIFNTKATLEGKEI